MWRMTVAITAVRLQDIRTFYAYYNPWETAVVKTAQLLNYGYKIVAPNGLGRSMRMSTTDLASFAFPSQTCHLGSESLHFHFHHHLRSPSFL